MVRKTDPKEVGLRVRAIFRKLGLSVEEAAEHLNEGRSNLTNCLNGYQLLRPEVAYELEKLLPGVSLQWIYFGDDRLLPAKLALDLGIFVEGFRQKVWKPGPVPKEPVAPEIQKAPRTSRKLARA